MGSYNEEIVELQRKVSDLKKKNKDLEAKNKDYLDYKRQIGNISKELSQISKEITNKKEDDELKEVIENLGTQLQYIGEKLGKKPKSKLHKGILKFIKIVVPIFTLCANIATLGTSCFNYKVASETLRLNKANESIVLKKDMEIKCKEDKGKESEDKYSIELSIEQGQVASAYVAMFDSEKGNDPIIIRVKLESSKDEKNICIPIEMVETSDKVNTSKDKIYLYADKTNHMELICLDSTGKKQKYYMLVMPKKIVDTANNTGINLKTKEVIEESKVEVEYELKEAPRIIFDCNLINKATIDDQISTYRQETMDYNQVINSQTIYDNIVNVDKLIRELL